MLPYTMLIAGLHMHKLRPVMESTEDDAPLLSREMASKSVVPVLSANASREFISARGGKRRECGEAWAWRG